jgi:hypothetical protein
LIGAAEDAFRIEAGRSLIVFLFVFGIASILARRVVFEMFGWLLHVLIDIPTHSLVRVTQPAQPALKRTRHPRPRSEM